MQKGIISLIILMITFSASGQGHENKCSLPENKYADSTPEKVFDLSNGNRIGLSGFVEKNNNEELYSEFVLAVCGASDIIGFWEATTTCRIRVENNKLFVETLTNLPVGPNFSYAPTVWVITEISFKNGQLQKGEGLNPKLPLYGSNEKARVLIDYAKANKVLNDEAMHLADKLFIATISGDQAARKYLSDFKDSFGPLDGEYSERYRDLVAMLRNWDHQSKR